MDSKQLDNLRDEVRRGFLGGPNGDVAALLDAYDAYEAALREIATNYDHDEDAHRYGTPCRMCLAIEALAGKEKAE